jgi:hypothetical protein
MIKRMAGTYLLEGVLLAIREALDLEDLREGSLP